MGNDESGFFDTRRAACYLGLSYRTLDGCRVSGAGPAFHRFGSRVRYRRSGLWMRGRQSAGPPRRRRPTGSHPPEGRHNHCRLFVSRNRAASTIVCVEIPVIVDKSSTHHTGRKTDVSSRPPTLLRYVPEEKPPVCPSVKKVVQAIGLVSPASFPTTFSNPVATLVAFSACWAISFNRAKSSASC